MISKVSLIVTSHNQLDYSKLMYDSLKQHTNYPYELIWVDCESTDGTREWLSTLGITPVFVRKMGIGEAMITGLSRCNPESEYIGDLDNDIILTNGWLKRLVKHMETDESLGACAAMSTKAWPLQGTIPFIPSKDNYKEDIQEFGREIAEREGVCPVSWVNGSHTLLRHRAIEDVGLWNPFLWWGEDKDIGIRLNEAGWQTVYARDTWVYHFHQKTTNSLDSEWHNRVKESLKRYNRLIITK